MSINDILVGKSISSIRRVIPSRFSHAMIVDQIYDLNTAEKYKPISNFWDNDIQATDDELFNTIVSAFRNGDEILSEQEIYYGEFHYLDYIVLNELFKPIQKWDLLFCISLFNGEEKNFELRLTNKTKQEYYWFSTSNFSYKDELLTIIKDLELIKLHKAFESLGGCHEIPSRFTDLVQRAGWDNGIKMIKVILRMLARLQEEHIISRDNVQTRICDRLQSDEHDIIYKFSPGSQGHQLVTRHLFEEDITSVRVFKDKTEIYNEEIVEWGEFMNN